MSAYTHYTDAAACCAFCITPLPIANGELQPGALQTAYSSVTNSALTMPRRRAFRAAAGAVARPMICAHALRLDARCYVFRLAPSRRRPSRSRLRYSRAENCSPRNEEAPQQGHRQTAAISDGLQRLNQSTIRLAKVLLSAAFFQ
jgi:hypothetical protein